MIFLVGCTIISIKQDIPLGTQYKAGVYKDNRSLEFIVELGEGACDGTGGYILPFEKDVIVLCMRGDHSDTDYVWHQALEHLRDVVLKIPHKEPITKVKTNRKQGK